MEKQKWLLLTAATKLAAKSQFLCHYTVKQDILQQKDGAQDFLRPTREGLFVGFCVGNNLSLIALGHFFVPGKLHCKGAAGLGHGS